jgi:hypothetical protein
MCDWFHIIKWDLSNFVTNSRFLVIYTSVGWAWTKEGFVQIR